MLDYAEVTTPKSEWLNPRKLTSYSKFLSESDHITSAPILLTEKGTWPHTDSEGQGRVKNICQKALWLPIFPGGASGQESTCQYRGCKRHRFDAWVGKIPWQPSPVFLPGKFRGPEPGRLQSMGPQSWTYD